jgi:hypothetical protein
MRRSLLVLAGLVAVVGCGDRDGDSDDVHRTVFVEVTSSPSGLLMNVSVGLDVDFEAETPIARNVRANLGFCTPLTAQGLVECLVFATARVKNVDPAGKRVTMCLTDAGEHDCATSNSGTVSVSMTVKVDTD